MGVGQIGGILTKSFSKYLNDNYSSKFKVNFNDYFYLYSPNIKDEFRDYKHIMKSEAEVFHNSKIVFNCVKPDIVQDVFLKSHHEIKPDSLIVSQAAGISIEYMEKLLLVKNKKAEVPKIIRMMTNHLCSVNAAATVYCTNNNANEMDEEIIKLLFSNLGIIKKVNETHINAFTALSGSGPAFVYHFIESLVDAGIKNGIDVNTAREYAIQTVMGAGKYMQEATDKNPNTHQYIVTTPKGTTN